MIHRPRLHFLDRELIERIISEAIDILCQLGCTIHNREALDLLSDSGARVEPDRYQVFFTRDLIESAIKDAPSAFALFDILGNQTHDFSQNNIYFTPGSAAIHILDHRSQEIRKPATGDYIEFCQVVSGLQFIDSQSTAFIPADVHEKISDSYRLYLSLLYCEKPVVTGAFTVESFQIMKDMQVAVRGSEKRLAAKPLTVFSCCPTSPLKWCEVTSQNLLDCARYRIPVEFISMPLSGFMAPVTLVGTLVAHTAETLSGLVLSQLKNPGTPVLYGGSPAIFDIRYETTPMGAVETQMIDCAYNEIGKYLNLPTQAYISLSDAKVLDAQAGLESAMGATLAALSGINNISGPGMLDFENCQSLEKLVLDNEICRMSYRLTKGITPKEDFPARSRFEELLKEKHLLISDHTRKFLTEEIHFPGPVINRANLSRWKTEGKQTLGQRARQEVEKLIRDYTPSRLDSQIQKGLSAMMEREARRHGMEKLPPHQT